MEESRWPTEAHRDGCYLICGILFVTITPIFWVQDTVSSDALVWPQFVLGERPDGTIFEVNFLVANTSSNEGWSGEILLADQFFFPANDVDIVELDDEAQGSARRFNRKEKVVGSKRSGNFRFERKVQRRSQVSLPTAELAGGDSLVTGLMILNPTSGGAG